MIPFNLACYDCRLGNLEAAKAFLEHALKLEPEMKLAALEDEDLWPLWDSI